MYAARVAEKAPVNELFEHPLHPYTWGLLGSLPRLNLQSDRLEQIPGQASVVAQHRRAAAPSTRAARTSSTGCREELPELRPVPRCTRDARRRPASSTTPTQGRARPTRILAAFDDGGVVARWRDELLKVEHLTKHFPVTRGLVFQKQVGFGQGGRRRLVSHSRRGETLGSSASPAAASRRGRPDPRACSTRPAGRSRGKAATSRHSRGGKAPVRAR